MEQERSDTERIEIDVTPAEIEEMNAYMAVCGLDSRTDLFNNALTLMYWMAEHRKAGHRIVSYDKESGEIASEAPTFEQLRAGWTPEKLPPVSFPYHLDVQSNGWWRFWTALQRLFGWRQ